MDIRKKQRAVVEALEDVKGRDIAVFNTERLPSMFERVIIASADSHRQVKALADRVTDRIESLGARVLGVEGEANAEWVLVDLGEIVVHVMHHAARSHYNLEELWGGKTVRMKKAEHAPARMHAPKSSPRKAAGAKKSPAEKAPARPRRRAARARRPAAASAARKAHP